MQNLPITYHVFLRRLAAIYGTPEARAMLRIVMERRFCLAWEEVLCKDFSKFSSIESDALEHILCRLERGEPLQYVLGEAEFCGLYLRVNPHVLIPRPETEDLVDAVEEEVKWAKSGENDHKAVLDIGTGSGSIALVLSLRHPSWQVVGWDNSLEALSVAAENAKKYGVKNVLFERKDALRLPPEVKEKWDVIVSNPPYVCLEERADMERNVLDYEPAEALFVPDDDPLLFYKAITEYAKKALTPQGQLFLEINPRFSHELKALLSAHGFTSITLKKDRFERERIIFATKE